MCDAAVTVDLQQNSKQPPTENALRMQFLKARLTELKSDMDRPNTIPVALKPMHAKLSTSVGDAIHDDARVPIIKSKQWNKWSREAKEPPYSATSPEVDHKQSTSGIKHASGDTEEHFAIQIAKKTKIDQIKKLGQLVCIELCAGSANLSRHLQQAGFQSIGIDHSRNVHNTKMHVIQIDLTKPSSFGLVKSIIDEGCVFYIHMAPPCGTASAARSRPIAAHLLAAGFPNPKPLRSKSRPLGLEGLSLENKQRVEQANRIYELCAKVVHICLQRSIAVSLENPENSLMWQIPYMKDLISNPALEKVVFDQCMLGGSRAKSTLWLGTEGLFSSMGLKCDNKHVHLPWTKGFVSTNKGTVPQFATAMEAEYPNILCQTASSLVKERAILQGYSLPADSLGGDLTQGQSRLQLQAGVGKQARGRKLPQLVSEFLSVHEHRSLQDQVVLLQKSQSVLRRFIRDEVGDNGTPLRTHISIVGTRRSPQEFLEQAKRVGHPYQPGIGVPENIQNALANILSLGPQGLMDQRNSKLKEIELLAAKLQKNEENLHATMPEHLRPVLQRKKILLMKELLISSGFKDVSICDQIITGFNTTGRCSESGMLERKLVPATIDVSDLKKLSSVARRAVLHQNRISSDVSIDKAVWDITKQEVDDKWLSGPITEQELSERFPDGWLLVPRFGIQQGSKIRAIDDCKLPGLNRALSTTEKLRIQDCDDLCSLISFVSMTIRGAINEERRFSISRATGGTLTGIVHASWGDLASLELQGRTLDLSSAYKNLGHSKDSLWGSILAIFNPDVGGYQFFQSNALMFGATASVYYFNRVARALQWIAIFHFNMLVNQYFDDYPGIEFKDSAVHSRSVFESFLGLLGWSCAEGEKAPPFSPTFTALGNTFDVTNVVFRGSFQVGNKPSRIQNIEGIISECRSKKALKPSVAAELAGKLQYTETQTFGGAAKPAVKLIRSRSHSYSHETAINDELDYALCFVLDYLRTALPRSVQISMDDEPILIFTDGSSEARHLWGAVVFGLTGGPVVAQGEIPGVLADYWLENTGTQIICQVELYPIILLKILLASKLESRRTVFYIDNDPSRDGLVSGASDSMCSRGLLYEFSRAQRASPSFNWFARVPSFSNYSDAPSRGHGLETARELHAQCFLTDLSLPLDSLRRLMDRC